MIDTVNLTGDADNLLTLTAAASVVLLTLTSPRLVHRLQVMRGEQGRVCYHFITDSGPHPHPDQI